jgi:hypothetical protein
MVFSISLRSAGVSSLDIDPPSGIAVRLAWGKAGADHNGPAQRRKRGPEDGSAHGSIDHAAGGVWHAAGDGREEPMALAASLGSWSGGLEHRGRIDHRRNVLRTRGLSEKGAEEVVRGQAPSDPVDEATARSPLVGGFLPGGSIVSAAVSSGSTLSGSSSTAAYG